MEERESSAYAELGGGYHDRQKEKESYFKGGVPTRDPYQEFLVKARAWLRKQGVPAARLDEVLYSMTDLFREGNWVPPKGHDGESAEWRVRANFRLPPARVEANAARVRDALNDARLRSRGPVGDGSSPEAPQNPQSAPQGDAEG